MGRWVGHRSYFFSEFQPWLTHIRCVFGEMLVGKPILSGESDAHQLDIIFDLVGTPTEETMPGWKSLPGAEALNPRPRPGSLSNRFRE